MGHGWDRKINVQMWDRWGRKINIEMWDRKINIQICDKCGKWNRKINMEMWD